MRRVIVALAIVGLTLASGVGAASARPEKPKITVTPNTGITNGMRLDVVVRRNQPTSQRSVYECTSDHTARAGVDGTCTLLKTNDTNPEGTLHVRVKAIVGSVGSHGGTCDADHSCLIVTFLTGTTKRPISAPISFAP